MKERITKIVTVTMNPAIDLSCTVPGFATGQVNRVVKSRTDAGGKGVNIARLLRQFGLPVCATGFLGDENPHIFEKLFTEQTIDDAFVRVAGETRIGVKILDSTAHTTTDINFPGLLPQTQHLQQLSATVANLASTATMVIIAGSVPTGLEAETVGNLVASARNQGAMVIVDTSGPALRHAIDAIPTLIKPNQEELSEYAGRQLKTLAETITVAQDLIARGIEAIVISLGAEGALFLRKGEVLRSRPPQIDAVSTVGAGDAMVGSLAAGLSLGMSWADCARLATAVSATVVTQAGPGLHSLQAAKAMEDRISIEQVSLKGGANE